MSDEEKDDETPETAEVTEAADVDTSGDAAEAVDASDTDEAEGSAETDDASDEADADDTDEADDAADVDAEDADGDAADEPAEADAAEEPVKAAKSARGAKTPKKAVASTGDAEADELTERVSLLKAHHLRPAPGAKKDRTRVGRGEGSKGKTAGRGTKGTKARYQVRPGFQGGQLTSVMRSPKLRGFTNPFRVEYQVVNLAKLAELYPDGGAVTSADLVAKGAVRKNSPVKVLGDGNITVKLELSVERVSASAEQKIIAAGGSVK